MQKIEIKLPQIEGAELKNVTTNIENGYVVAEYGEKVQEPKFKKGDILYCEYFRNGGCNWICINENINNIGNGRYFSCLIIKSNTDSTNVFKLKNASFQNTELDIIRLATDSEKQILFDALARGGRYWDAEALKVKDFVKVPESIGIYKSTPEFEEQGDNLYIGFNENEQVLGFHNGVYTVHQNDDQLFKKVQCYLQPCKREDLKAGDTALFSPTFRLAEDITSDLDRYVKIVGKAAYKTRKNGDVTMERNFASYWFELTPING